MRWIMTLLMLFSFVFAKDHYEFHMPRDLGYLNLNAGQKEQISKIVYENRKERTKLHEEKEKAEKQMKALFLQREFDEKKVTQMYTGLKERSIRLHVKMLKNIHDTLTPQQRELFLNYIEEWEVE